MPAKREYIGCIILAALLLSTGTSILVRHFGGYRNEGCKDRSVGNSNKMLEMPWPSVEHKVKDKDNDIITVHLPTKTGEKVLRIIAEPDEWVIEIRKRAYVHQEAKPKKPEQKLAPKIKDNKSPHKSKPVVVPTHVYGAGHGHHERA